MNTYQNTQNDSDTLEIMALEPGKTKVDAGTYTGVWGNLEINTTARRDGSERKDLIATVKVTNPEAGQPAELMQVFNLLRGKRGKAHFKKAVSSWLERDLTDEELSRFNKATVLNKPVICVYKTNQLGNGVVFDTYLPVKTDGPVAS